MDEGGSICLIVVAHHVSARVPGPDYGRAYRSISGRHGRMVLLVGLKTGVIEELVSWVRWPMSLSDIRADVIRDHPLIRLRPAPIAVTGFHESYLPIFAHFPFLLVWVEGMGLCSRGPCLTICHI